MKAFAALFAALDETTRTNDKVDALAIYFAAVPPADAAWAVYFLCGRKPRQAVAAAKLRAWAAEAAGIPEWLLDESHQAVGDSAETVTLLLPDPVAASELPLHHWIETRLLPLAKLAEADRKDAVLAAWAELDSAQRFLWNKLITGGFRVGVSKLLVTRGLAKASGLHADAIALRLMGDWKPTAESYASLIAADAGEADPGRPYPFFLAHPLQANPQELGEAVQWQAEWKWDGIRAQLIRRAGRTFLWTRGEELVTDRYPELAALGDRLPEGTALDGEILPWKDGKALPFAQLQKRIGRKAIGKKLLAEVPVALAAYDLLERDGVDLRGTTLTKRRSSLENLVAAQADPSLLISPVLSFDSWNALETQRAESRSRGVEGLMLKRRASPYRSGRVAGDWWKWKIEPLTMDAVLIAAQKGSGKRASLYTDYTFGIRDGDAFVTIAKAYSGLTDAEIREVDAFIRRNTLETFGPVRTVKPELVFELGFEGIQESKRHKAGIAVRFPRMLRWRTDKKPADADTLDGLRKLLQEGPAV